MFSSKKLSNFCDVKILSNSLYGHFNYEYWVHWKNVNQEFRQNQTSGTLMATDISTHFQAPIIDVWVSLKRFEIQVRSDNL